MTNKLVFLILSVLCVGIAFANPVKDKNFEDNEIDPKLTYKLVTNNLPEQDAGAVKVTESKKTTTKEEATNANRKYTLVIEDNISAKLESQIEELNTNVSTLITNLKSIEEGLDKKFKVAIEKLNEDASKRFTSIEEIIYERLNVLKELVIQKCDKCKEPPVTPPTPGTPVHPTCDETPCEDWMRSMCDFSTADQQEPKTWGPGIVPDADCYDDTVKEASGCERRLVPAYDRQKFASFKLEDSSNVVERRLAVRTVEKGRTDIKIYWNGQKRHYFAFSNINNTVELFHYDSPFQLLKKVVLPYVEKEHYVPLKIKMEPERLTFSAGCCQPSYEFPIATAVSDVVVFEIETSSYPAKLLYNCPQGAQ